MTPKPLQLENDIAYLRYPELQMTPSAAETSKSREPEIVENNFEPNGPLWVFGYGSLMWNPGFEYERSYKGVIHGFSRHFSQGNIGCRGTEHMVSCLID